MFALDDGVHGCKISLTRSFSKIEIEAGCYDCVMTYRPSIFETADDAADEAADAEGIADLDAGRVISHHAMRDWLLSRAHLISFHLLD